MEIQIIGRKEEQARLALTLQSQEAELVAVFGRRRVGKTFLITTAYRGNIVFEMTGIQNGALNDQLQNFTDQLTEFAKPSLPIKTPEKWLEAFKLLRDYLQKTLTSDKKVLFFDELPWLANQKSGFLEAFGYFWNSWASRQNLVIVICGSATSWMIQKVVNDRGGLHNRITCRIHLEAFTLAESEAYLQSRGVFFDRYQIVQLYMAMGGIPHYLREIMGSKSAIQNIDSICFSKNGLLSDEFERLYPSLFANADAHIALIRTLVLKKQGMTRFEIIEKSNFTNGGGLTKVLEELIESGFVSAYFPFGKKAKDKIYRLTDEYSLFFLQFIEQNRYQGGSPWNHISQSQAYQSWSGYAFEGICIKHLPQIKSALSIAGIHSVGSSFFKKSTPTETGCQIDLVLDRNDHCINLFEIKFYNKPYLLTKEYADKLRQTLWAFQSETKSRKQLNWVFISTYGLTSNQHSIGLVANSLSLDDLFV
jgi:uncharacterized protein